MVGNRFKRNYKKKFESVNYANVNTFPGNYAVGSEKGCERRVVCLISYFIVFFHTRSSYDT